MPCRFRVSKTDKNFKLNVNFSSQSFPQQSHATGTKATPLPVNSQPFFKGNGYSPTQLHRDNEQNSVQSLCSPKETGLGQRTPETENSDIPNSEIDDGPHENMPHHKQRKPSCLVCQQGLQTSGHKILRRQCPVAQPKKCTKNSLLHLTAYRTVLSHNLQASCPAIIAHTNGRPSHVNSRVHCMHSGPQFSNLQDLYPLWTPHVSNSPHHKKETRTESSLTPRRRVDKHLIIPPCL